MTKKTLYFIFVILLLSNGFLVYISLPVTNYDIDKVFQPAKLLKINNNDSNCENYQEEIARDNEYIYYLSCIKSDTITIQYLDGDEYTLKELLENNYLTIDDLISAGLIIEKKSIKVVSEKPSEENNTPSVKPNQELPNISNDKDNPILLSTKEILEYNKKIINKTDMYYNLDKYTNANKNDIKTYIEKYQLPKLPKYNGSEELNNNNIQDILANRNLENITANIRKGIIISRANLRSMPTNIHFYDNKNKQDFDRLQETELHINTPVLIVHESKDNLWYFVISPFYMGWIEKSKVALATKEDIDYFVNSSKFIIITDASINVNDEILDMSVRLPLVGENDANYNVVLPIKDVNGNVSKKSIVISKDKANDGYLPYTKENIIKQAEKYLGVNYSWGGMDKGVDCSSFVSNVYRTFGFTFPRNTSSQNQSVGKIISLVGKTDYQKLELIKNTEPSLLFQNGHVMLYIGNINNVPYIIHASGSTMKVSKIVLTNSSYLKNINKLVLVGK